LRSVGALDGCVARGFSQSFFKTCDANGNVTGTVELPNLLGSPYPATVGIMRHEVHSTLVALLDELEVPVRLGVTIESVSQNATSADVAFTDGSRERFDLVVGADGSNSAVREMLFGPKVRPHYTGQMNWRANEPTARSEGPIFLLWAHDQIGI
jgi:2-polyprenyl-6-methoxyphenol hydroxylase-like FAD-dependent oxidoreductase